MIQKSAITLIFIASLFTFVACAPKLVNLKKIDKKFDQEAIEKDSLYQKYKPQYNTIQLYHVEKNSIDYDEKRGFTIIRTVHQQYKIVKGKKFTHKIYVDENSEILYLSARTIKAGGEVVNLDMDDIFIENINEYTTKDHRQQKTVKYNFQDVDDNATVELILKLRKTYKTPQYLSFFYNTDSSAFPTLFYSFEIDVPSWIAKNKKTFLQSRYKVGGGKKLELKKSEYSANEQKRTKFKWSASDIPTFDKEASMICSDCHRGTLQFVITPWKNWKEMSIELYKLYFANTFVSSQAIQQKADELTKGIADEKEKITRITHFVQSLFQDSYHIIHPYTLQSPESVLRRGYGSNKELATLLVSLLRASGIVADIAFIRDRYSLPLDQAVMINNFDDTLVYCSTAHGEKYWLDPTHYPSDINLLTGYYQNQKALIITQKGAETLLTTPTSALEDNKTDIAISYTIDNTLTLKTHIDKKLAGDDAYSEQHTHTTFQQRQIFTDVAADLKDEYFNGFWGANGSVSNIAYGGEKPGSHTASTAFDATIAALRPSLYEKDEFTLDTIPLTSGFFVYTPSISQETRKYPINLGKDKNTLTITTTVTYPSNLLEVLSLPQKLTTQLDDKKLLFTFDSKEENPGKIVITLNFTQNAHKIGADKYQEVKNFYTALRHTFLSHITFKKK